MSPERFEHLLSIVAPYITKKACRSRIPIPANERLCVCLKYLATGDSQQEQSFNFRMGKSTVCNIIRETCDGLWDALQPTYMKAPETVQDWIKVANEFEEQWNFPNCIGAVDGKHVRMECPREAGSAFFNYKNFHSIVLMAVCDAKYCFTLVDVGGYGRDNDASILNESLFGQMFENGEMSTPLPRKVGDYTLPYALVGDDIFGLKPWLMKPYPGKYLDETKRIYNYRLSRARRTIENSFGIMAARWRIYQRPIRASVQTVEKIVKATLCLHNYLRLTENACYLPSGFVDSENGEGDLVEGDWRAIAQHDDGMANLGRIGGNRYTFEAARYRDDFKQYFNSDLGAVPWQYQHVRNCGKVALD